LAGTLAGAGRFLSSLDEIEPALDAIEAAVDPIDPAGDAGVLRLEKTEPLLHLDHRRLQLPDLAPDGTEMFEDQVGTIV